MGAYVFFLEFIVASKDNNSFVNKYKKERHEK